MTRRRWWRWLIHPAWLVVLLLVALLVALMWWLTHAPLALGP